MENFIPADGKSIGFIRALQFAVPVPPVETPPVVSNNGGGKNYSISNKTVLIGAIVVVGVVAFFVRRWYQRQYGTVKTILPGNPPLPQILKPTEGSKSAENHKPQENSQQPEIQNKLDC